ncbi:MAG TPA: CHAT domain-containing protein, partial [Pyrinomonadaceae bacterium]|nr:CHAT domain-containing protein [Pyrinomonadaceae bacterium]
IEKLRTQVAGSERDRELSFESKTAPYLEMVKLLIEGNDLAGAFLYAERAKGRMLLDVLRYGRADITRSMTAEERDKERNLNTSMTSISSQIRREIALPQPDQTKLANLEARLQQARLEYEAYETRIYAAHPELRTQRGDTQSLTLSEVERLLPDQQTALLEYVVAPEKTYLFVLTRGPGRRGSSVIREGKGLAGDKNASAVKLRVFSIPITSRELANRVTQFHQVLAGNSLGFKQLARQLYDLLLLPAQEELESRTAVGIVPSNQLWELPFQALLSQRDRYVLQDHALFYAPSLSVLGEMRKKDARGPSRNLVFDPSSASIVKVSATAADTAPSLLAMGNPRLSANLVSRAQSNDRSISLGDLPEAEREVKDLGEIYGVKRSKILTGLAAQEGTVKAEAGRYPVLHFATHGLLDDENPLYSRLLLATSNENDDGFLEAREIMKLDLRANLAVLSACQTARGTIGPGEGLIGMSWAFFIAGTSTTVVSQWKVDSASTARLMVDFHRQLQSPKDHAGASKAEALRQAALKLMSDPKYRHPFFWSGFVVVGNGMN